MYVIYSFVPAILNNSPKKLLGPAGLPFQTLNQEVCTGPLLSLLVFRAALIHQVSACLGHLDRLA
jgi:hypothetical protein